MFPGRGVCVCVCVCTGICTYMPKFSQNTFLSAMEKWHYKIYLDSGAIQIIQNCKEKERVEEAFQWVWTVDLNGKRYPVCSQSPEKSQPGDLTPQNHPSAQAYIKSQSHGGNFYKGMGVDSKIFHRQSQISSHHERYRHKLIDLHLRSNGQVFYLVVHL